ncbi:MAG TPA: polyprenyl synthetase family protein [Pseudonocardia sp.]
MKSAHPLAVDRDGRLVEHIETTLTGYLARRRLDAEQVHPCFADAADALTRFVLEGGKRIRPTFAWWGWRGAGGDPGGTGDPDTVLRAISALELVQACALVHDDLMDHSDTRRGNPAVHIEFARRHRRDGWGGPPEDYGASAAILLGDLALAWADDMLHGSGMTEEQHARVRPVWAAMRTEVLGGQFLDAWSQASGDESVEAAMRVNRFKTAAYTVERPLLLGAALAGAPSELVEAYRSFGTDIGVAFQLRDDLLGVFGDPAVTGKPAGDDLREGKRTLLMALAFEAAHQDGCTSGIDTLTGALGGRDLDTATLERAREVLHELGAVAEVERRIELLTESGLAALATADVAAPADTALTELAHAATRRRS